MGNVNLTIQTNIDQLIKRVDALEGEIRQLNGATKQYQQTNSKAFNQASQNVKQATAGAKTATNVFRTLGTTIAASFSVVAITAFIKKTFELSQIQAAAQAKVAQAIKATGGAAGFSAEELNKVASELQSLTTYGDEEILNKVTAQLLTFPNIVGENFKKAQKTVLDIATLLEGDLQSSAIMLGKALQDPMVGLMAMRRIGISFSEQEQARIKTLVEQNKLYDAQRMILEIIDAQYGGQAEALAKLPIGKIQQMNNAWGDLRETIGNGVAPALASVAENLKNIFETFNTINTTDTFSFWEKLKIAITTGAGDIQGALNIVNENLIQSNRLERAFKAGGEAAITSFEFMTKELGKSAEDAANEIMAAYKTNLNAAEYGISVAVNQAERDRWETVKKNAEAGIAQVEKLLKDYGKTYEKAGEEVFNIETASIEKLLQMRATLVNKYGDLLEEANKQLLENIEKEIKYREEQQERLNKIIEERKKAIMEEVNVEIYRLRLLRDIDAAEQVFKQNIEEYTKKVQDLTQALQQLTDAYRDEAEVDDIPFDTEAVKQKIDDFNAWAEDNKIWASLGFQGDEQVQDFKKVVGEISNITEQLVQDQIDASDRIIEAYNNQISEQEQLLNRELELKKEGYANDYELEKERLTKLQEARDEELKQREKWVKIQRIQNMILQASELATAAAKLFAVESTKGIAGVVVALGAIALMLSAFLAFKKQSAAATQLKKGGWLEGKSHEQGGIPLMGGKYEAEGGEFMVNKKSAKNYAPLIEAINTNDKKAMQLWFDRNFLTKMPPVVLNSKDIDDSKLLGELVRQGKRSQPTIVHGQGYYIEKYGTFTKRVNLS